MAIKRFRESIEYSTRNAPKLEVAPTYCSICSCYRLMGDYENMLAMAREAKKHLERASEKTKLEIALDECYALFLLHRDKEFREAYDSLKVNHPEILSDKSVMCMAIPTGHDYFCLSFHPVCISQDLKHGVTDPYVLKLSLSLCYIHDISERVLLTLKDHLKLLL